MISFTSLLPIILPGKLCNETLVNFHRNFHINNMPIVIAKQVTLRHQVSHHTISLLQTCASRGLLTTSYKTLKLKKHSLRKIQNPALHRAYFLLLHLLKQVTGSNDIKQPYLFFSL